MAEEEVLVVSAAAAAAAAAAAESPAPSDHKRKHVDFEPDAPQPPSTETDAEAEKNSDDVDGERASDESESKRPRLENNGADGLAKDNGFESAKTNEEEEENADDKETPEKTRVENPPSVVETEQQPVGNGDENQADQAQQPSLENSQDGSAEQLSEQAPDMPQQGDDSAQQQPSGDAQTISRKMQVPNNKVGVLIGKAGDTIRYLQYNSGAKIQITRDADADPYSTARPVELIGTLDSINRAEKLIKDVIAEADAGGSPSLVARGFTAAQFGGSAGEQVEMQVPNEKVGLIIGKGGETIKNLQTRSGARIQLIPQHLAEGDQSKERTVRICGDKKQIEVARDMIKDVMNQTMRPSPLSSGYNQQAYRPRGPAGPPQWAVRGPHPGHPMAYDYHQRGPYNQNQQYPPPSYGGYPQQQPPRSGFGPGWEHRPSAGVQGPHHSGGYDYYGGQGGHPSEGPTSAPLHSMPHPSGQSTATAMGPPPAQANYNYGHQGQDYGQQAHFSHTAPQLVYGHGYDEQPKFENQPQAQQPYGHGSTQPGVYQQAGYGPQQQYGKPPVYGMPSQAPPQQPYGPGRTSQPGDVPYQGPVPSSQPYGSNVPQHQPYQYPASAPMQQTYPQYNSAPASTDGYNQPLPVSAPGPGYQQHASYGQPGGQQAPGYPQAGAAAGYGSYPASQLGYSEQPVQSNVGYGYQGSTDPNYGSVQGAGYGPPPSAQAGYVQPTPTQPYDQSAAPQSAGYAGVPPGNMPAGAGYGKSLSPQPGYPQYDSAQIYGAPR
ncbi:K Homology domain, type 1 [Dillenia turbinata]|uniref:K Homology domain, type 1 n=1 Tax=Dillenia turbinata TaxID=194707 RepID=A0AAN8ZKX5_9MAGN